MLYEVITHLGGICEFLQRKKIESLKQLETKVNSNTSNGENTKEKNTSELSFEEKKEINRTIDRLEKKIMQTEDTIAKLEIEIEALDEVMSSPENIDDHSVFEKYEKLKHELEETMNDWEHTHEELEKWQSQKNW